MVIELAGHHIQHLRRTVKGVYNHINFDFILDNPDEDVLIVEGRDELCRRCGKNCIDDYVGRCYDKNMARAAGLHVNNSIQSSELVTKLQDTSRFHTIKEIYYILYSALTHQWHKSEYP